VKRRKICRLSEQLLVLEPESVTIHTLAIKRSSRLAQELELDSSGQSNLAINRRTRP
jgi:hypothetical protein